VETTRLVPPEIPAKHQEYLRALQQVRCIAFTEATIEECLEDLSRTLGTELRLRDGGLERLKEDPRRITTETDVPMSHLTALQFAMKSVGHSDAGLIFEDQRLLLFPAVILNRRCGRFLCAVGRIGRWQSGSS
jgi:hypothetical protein